MRVSDGKIRTKTNKESEGKEKRAYVGSTVVIQVYGDTATDKTKKNPMRRLTTCRQVGEILSLVRTGGGPERVIERGSGVGGDVLRDTRDVVSYCM